MEEQNNLCVLPGLRQGRLVHFVAKDSFVLNS